MKNPAHRQMTDAALERVLRYARTLADADTIDQETQRRGLFATMQQAAIQLDGLTAAVRDYDRTLELIAEYTQGETKDPA